LTYERAVEIILEKTDSDKKKIIKDFGDMMLLNGRYGPYLVKDKLNYRLPKGSDAEKLTREDCIKIIGNNDKTKKSS
jgi:DNA topoisomerase-1